MDGEEAPETSTAAAPEQEAESSGKVRLAGVRALPTRLANGISGGFVAALAALVLIAILFTVASRAPSKPRAFSELTLGRGSCAVDRTRHSGAVGCTPIGPRAYRVIFSRSLDGSTAIASLGSCCPGEVGASIESPQTVIIALGKRVRNPVRVSVFVP